MQKMAFQAGSWRNLVALVCGLVCLTGSSPLARAATATFNFAQVGTSFSAALLGDDPLIGKEVTTARIYLDVEIFPGSDAANFFTDISFPIEPFPGNTNALVLTGSELGWSGAGTFHYFEETTRFNGIFAAFRYGGETPGENFDGMILSTSRIEFDYIDEGGGELSLESAVSRKTHDRKGAFDVDLPLDGAIGIESRTGPGEIVFTFNNAVSTVAGATSSCGQAGKPVIDPADAHVVTVQLREIPCNRDEATVTLAGVMDEDGNTLDAATVSFGVLFGDVNGDGRVDAADSAAARKFQGSQVNSGNFRADLDIDGRINNRDLDLVKRFRGDSLP